jgi:hypothetical protein
MSLDIKCKCNECKNTISEGDYIVCGDCFAEAEAEIIQLKTEIKLLTKENGE